MYAGIAIGLLLLLAGVAVCVLALCRNKCHTRWVVLRRLHFLAVVKWWCFDFFPHRKHNAMDYGVTYDPDFDPRAEVSWQKCPINHQQTHFSFAWPHKSNFLLLLWTHVFSQWITPNIKVGQKGLSAKLDFRFKVIDFTVYEWVCVSLSSVDYCKNRLQRQNQAE